MAKIVRWGVEVHPLMVRVNHWVNALAVIIMVMSGWRIYDASPVFATVYFPEPLTLGGWLGGALQWHFAAMWLLVGNGLVYLIYNIVSGRMGRKFAWPGVKAIIQDVRDTLRFKLSHEDLAHYNAVQKFAYLGVMAALVVVVMSGLVVWKNVQFPHLRELMGGYEGARIVHFAAMAAIVLFIVVHVAMSLVVPKTFVAMTGLGPAGRKK